MPWKAIGTMEQRREFIRRWSTREESVVELCDQFEISRKTAYKWIGRYEQRGQEGLVERSSRPHTSPQAIAPAVQELVLEARSKHRHWGPRKLLTWLEGRHPGLELPAPSTVGDLLRRHGLVKPRRQRRAHVATPSTALTASSEPNVVSAMDFKGWFRTGDGKRCNPFTVTDTCSRYLFVCRHLERGTETAVRAVLEEIFREYGLPQVIRSDNGSPFASTGLGGLSKLAVWLMRVGIEVERIEPGKPQQNGRHERMHRTLKQEAASPPAATLRAQLRQLDTFRRIYNWERPHEALNGRTPGSVYVRSPRCFPDRLPELVYPDGALLRRVHLNGCFKWKGRYLFLSESLVGQTVSLQEIDDETWLISFGSTDLAVFLEREHCLDLDLDPYLGSLEKVLPMSPV